MKMILSTNEMYTALEAALAMQGEDTSVCRLDALMEEIMSSEAPVRIANDKFTVSYNGSEFVYEMDEQLLVMTNEWMTSISPLLRIPLKHLINFGQSLLETIPSLKKKYLQFAKEMEEFIGEVE